MARLKTISRNLAAFLDMIATSEGTIGRGDDGYNVIVTGIDGKIELMPSYADHPFADGRLPKVINRAGLLSTASGRYQQMRRDWQAYKDLLKLPDFGPESQDRLAIQHIRECKALADIEAGRFADAVTKCRGIWASLPGAGYGQRENSLATLQAAYIKAGGVLA